MRNFIISIQIGWDKQRKGVLMLESIDYSIKSLIKWTEWPFYWNSSWLLIAIFNSNRKHTNRTR